MLTQDLEDITRTYIVLQLRGFSLFHNVSEKELIFRPK